MMRLLNIMAIAFVLLFIVACVPEPQENITIKKTVKVVEEKQDVEVEETVLDEPKEVKEEVKENTTNTTPSPSPITGSAAVNTQRTVVAGTGMIEVEEGEVVKVIVPD